MYPDSPEIYVKLLQAIDRPTVAAHFDPVNLINCPQRYFTNGEYLKHCFKLLGPYIKSCHAKDILLGQTLTVHLDEVRPGLGGLDYRVFLSELNKLDAKTPLILEHLPNEEEYELGARYIREVAFEGGIQL